MHIMCLGSVSLQSDIANYWPGMHNTAFLVVFTDSCEQDRFDGVVTCIQKLLKNAQEKCFQF